MQTLFLDTEFTGLHRNARLISLALYNTDENYFYAEFNDYDTGELTEWLQQHVISKLEYNNTDFFIEKSKGHTRIKNNAITITAELTLWLLPL